jgi:tetratricopeptide (TPR) repeat protein
VFREYLAVFRGSRLAGWARRGIVLASTLGLAASIAALGKLLSMSWLIGVGLAIALLGGLLRVVSALREDERDRQNRTRVPVEDIREVDPIRVGIDPAPQSILPGGEVPEYLPREVDGELDAAIAGALGKGERWIVIAVGSSKVGKSRAMFEGLLRNAQRAEVQFVAPVDYDALKALLSPGELPGLQKGFGVLWLDDLEPFVDQGMTMQTLERWHERFPHCVVAATYGGKGNALITGSADGDLGTIASEIRRRASEICLEATSKDELDPLRSNLPRDVLASIERHGLAVHLVAGPELSTKLTTRRHRPGDPECPEGIGVVYAAVDWVRAGRTDPIPKPILRDLWPEYLPPGSDPTDDGFEAGIKWALAPVAGSIALLEDLGGYRAYDYVIGLVASKAEAQVHRPSIWRRALEGATDAQALSVGAVAFSRGQFEDAAAGFEAAAQSPSDPLAALALYDLGVALGKLGRHEDEISAYEEVVVRFGEADELAVRESVAGALVNKAITLGELDRNEQAIAIYEEVVTRFGEAEPELRKQVGRALVNMGARFGVLERQEQEIATYEEVVTRFGDAEEPELRESAARALFNKGAALGLMGRHEQEIAIYDEVVDRFGGAEEPESLEHVAGALFNKGTILGLLERFEEAVSAFDEILFRFGDADEPLLRQQLTRALVNKGAALGSLGRFDQAIPAFDEVVNRFGEAEELELRESVARALANKAIACGELELYDQAIPAFDEVVNRFGEAEEPGLRGLVAGTLVSKGDLLEGLELYEQAIPALDEVVNRFGEAEELGLRESVAMALIGKARNSRKLKREEQAILAFDEVVNRFDEAEESELREFVAGALIGKGALLGALGRFEQAIAVFDESLARFDEEKVPQRAASIARALVAKGLAFEALERHEQAVASYKEVLTRFGDEEEPELREQVDRAAERLD